MDDAVAGPSTRNAVDAAGYIHAERGTTATIRVAYTPPIALTVPQKGSRKDLPYLHYNDVNLIRHEDGDSDDDESNHKASDQLFCLYCGDVSTRKNIQRHTDHKHNGKNPEWTKRYTYSRKMRERVVRLASEKPYVLNNDTATAVTVIDNAVTVEELKKAKRTREMKNRMKAKKARHEASDLATLEGHFIQRRDGVGSEQEHAEHSQDDDEMTADAILYPPIKPADEKAFRREMCNIRSIEALVEKTRSFKVNRDEGYIECVPCKSKISYNFDFGEAFQAGSVHPKFGELKHSVLTHMFGSVSHEKVTSGNSGVTSEEDKQAGKIIGRKVYGFIISGTKHLQFKNELYKSKLDESQIGDINHSGYALQKLLPFLYECQAANVAKQVNALNPITTSNYITITADKVTLHNKTFHVVGLFYVQKGGLQNVFLKVIENEGGSGSRLAEEMVQSAVHTLGISRDELAKRLVNIATDGQYIKNHIQDHMNEILGDKGDFRTFAWDIAHLIELAARKSRDQYDKKDIRTIKEPWLKNAFCISRSISTYYRQPLNLQRLGHLAAKKLKETDIDALVDFPEVEEVFESFFSPLTFKKFSDTRWAQYTKNTFYSIIRNYRIMFLDLHGCEGEPVRELSQEEEEHRVNVSNAEYILSVNGLMDIYEIVTSMSLNAQKSKAFVWDVLHIHETELQKLLQLSEDFSQPIRSNPRLRPNFHKAALQLTQQGKYRSSRIERLAVPIVHDDFDCNKDKDTFATHIDAVIKDISTKLGKYAELLVQKLRKEEQERVPKLLFWTKDAFNIKLIRSRGDTVIPENLEELFNASKVFGIYPDPALSFQDFLREYDRFVGYVKSMMHERDLSYTNLLFTNDIDCFPNVKQLLAASAARSCCEGIIESYGSIMKKRLHHRERLALFTYNAELFLKINGPPICKANGLIQAAWNKYFEGKPWHFYRRSEQSRLKTYKISKALDPFEDVDSKFEPIPEEY